MNQAIPDATDVVQLNADVTSVQERAKADFNFLAQLCMPSDYRFPFPPFYLTLFHLLTRFAKKLERFAVGIPRGFAKTTWVKLMCVYYVLFTHKHFILIVAASEAKASAILADIVDMLSSPNIRAVFGHWDAHIEEDQSTKKVFYFRGKEMILWAAGAGTSVRGIARKLKRPDVIVMDDIQDREDAKNKDLADALTTWMLSTLMKARSPFGCTYIFVGNMYPQNSLLEKLKNNKHWVSFVVGGILADVTSLWEDLKPIDELLEEYETDTEMGHPEVFISEVLNSTEIALASGIDIGRIPHIPQYLDTIDVGEGSFIIIDPSSGKKSSDDCTINHYEIKDGIPILDEIKSGTFTVTETVKEALEIGFRRNTRLICVEDVAYQNALLQRFEEYCEEQGISGYYFEPVSPKNQAKNNRIKRGLIRLLKGEIYLSKSVRSTVLAQIVDWNPIKTNNTDDIIDPIGYVEEVQREYPELTIRNVFDVEDESVSATDTSTLVLPF